MTTEETKTKDCLENMSCEGDVKEKQEVVTKQPEKSQDIDDLDDDSLESTDPMRWGWATCMVCCSDLMECILDIFLCCVLCGQSKGHQCLSGICGPFIHCCHPCGLLLSD